MTGGSRNGAHRAQEVSENVKVGAPDVEIVFCGTVQNRCGDDVDHQAGQGHTEHQRSGNGLGLTKTLPGLPEDED